MKTATALLRSAESLGIILWVEGGQLRYKARQPVSDGLKERIKEHKAEIIDLLSNKNNPMETDSTPCCVLPEWCNSRCQHYHRLEVPGLEVMHYCCTEQDATNWRRIRIDLTNNCPHIAGKVKFKS